MAESNGLLNRQGVKTLGGSNPPRSATLHKLKDIIQIMENFSKIKFYKFIDSSVLHSCAWSDDHEALIIVFNSGAVWLYSDATAEHFESLKNAQSSGKYFNSNIRNTLHGTLIFKKGLNLVQEA